MTERERIKNKYGGKCYLCGSLLGDKFHVDHKEPIERKFGYHPETRKWVQLGMRNPEKDRYENKFPACQSCNINKHSMSIEEFRRVIQGYVNSLNRDSTQYKMAKRYGLVEETEKKVVFFFETFQNN